MLAGVTIVDPASTWIDAGVDARGRRRRPPVHGAARRDDGRRGRRDRPARGRGRRVDRWRVRWWGRSVTFAPEPFSRRGRRRARSWRSRTRVSARARRCRTSPTSATPTSARTPTSPPGTSPRTSRTTRIGRKERTKIGRNVRTGVDNTFVAPVTVGDDAWVASGTVVTDDVPPGSLAGFPPRQETKEGWVYERGEPENMATTELARLPGLEAVTEHAHPAPGHWIERGPQKRLMVFSGRSHPDLAQRDRREARRRARRHRARARSRTTRPTAASTSRSAVPTSSSSRPAARRWTRT